MPLLGYVVDQKSPYCTPIVRPCDGPEVLLAGGVPNLQFDSLSEHRHHPRGELDPQSHLMVSGYLLLHELRHYAAFAHSFIELVVPVSPITMNFSR